MTNVTFISANSYSAGTTSVDIVGSNKNVVAWVVVNPEATPTYNGVNFTELGQVQNSGGLISALYYLPNPATGANNLVVGGSAVLYAFAGQNTSIPIDTYVIILSSTTICNITPNLSDGLIFCGGGGASGSDPWTANSGQTHTLSAVSTLTTGVQASTGAGVSIATSWTVGAHNFLPQSTFAVSLAPIIEVNPVFLASD